MRKLVTIASIFLVAVTAAAAAAAGLSPCCKQCPQLAPPSGVPSTPPNPLVKGCVEVTADTCAGGAVLDTRNGESELVDGCLCLAGNCVANVQGNPAAATPSQCAAAAAAECGNADNDKDLGIPPIP